MNEQSVTRSIPPALAGVVELLELEGRTHATGVRLAHLLSGVAPDLVEQLDVALGHKVWFGPRGKQRHHDATWNIAQDFLLAHLVWVATTSPHSQLDRDLVRALALEGGEELALPWLPGPARAKDRIAPFACYFTDPFLEPVARAIGLPVCALAAVALVGVASALAALPG